MLRNPSEQQLARCVGFVGPSIRGASTTLPLWEPGPQVLPPRSMLRSSLYLPERVYEVLSILKEQPMYKSPSGVSLRGLRQDRV